MKWIIIFLLGLILCGCQINFLTLKSSSWVYKFGIILDDSDIFELYESSSLAGVFRPLFKE